jgi:hypothetical protein
VDGQPPTGRESLGGSIGSGRRSYSRLVDSAASSSGWLADASNVRLLIVSERHPAGFPYVIWETLRCNACEGTLPGAGGNRPIRGHCHGRSRRACRNWPCG